MLHSQSLPRSIESAVDLALLISHAADLTPSRGAGLSIGVFQLGGLLGFGREFPGDEDAETISLDDGNISAGAVIRRPLKTVVRGDEVDVVTFVGIELQSVDRLAEPGIVPPDDEVNVGRLDGGHVVDKTICRSLSFSMRACPKLKTCSGGIPY
jgi:hypothetical protein